ncbi:MAG: hypothetical protein WDO69_16495 [Pseudomonadota bacterium]
MPASPSCRLVWRSSGTSAAAQATELKLSDRARREAEARAQQQLEQNATLLKEVSRGLHPLGDATVDFWLEVPFDEPELKSFVEGFVRDSKRAYDNCAGRCASLFERVEIRPDGSLFGFAIDTRSPLFPKFRAEPRVFQTVNSSAVLLRWFRAYSESKAPDQPGRFSVEGRGFKSQRAEWASTGNIVSLLDIPGSQVFIEIYDDGWDRPSAKRDFRMLMLNVGDEAIVIR